MRLPPTRPSSSIRVFRVSSIQISGARQPTQGDDATKTKRKEKLTCGENGQGRACSVHFGGSAPRRVNKAVSRADGTRNRARSGCEVTDALAGYANPMDTWHHTGQVSSRLGSVVILEYEVRITRVGCDSLDDLGDVDIVDSEVEMLACLLPGR